MPSFRWSAINGGGEVVQRRHGRARPHRRGRAAAAPGADRAARRPGRRPPRPRRAACRSRSAAAAASTRSSLGEATRELGDHADGGAGSRPRAALYRRQHPQRARPHDPRPGPRQGALGQFAGGGARRRAAQLFQALYRPGARRRSGRHLARHPRPPRGAPRARAQPERQPARGIDLPGAAGGRRDRLDRLAARLRVAAIHPDLRAGRGAIADRHPAADEPRRGGRRGDALPAGGGAGGWPGRPPLVGAARLPAAASTACCCACRLPAA